MCHASTLRSAVAALALAGLFGAEAAQPGDTAVLKWKDGKKAVFLLAFDDSCPSHVRYAIPELTRRGLVGTFYINPGNGPLQSARQAWEREFPTNPAVVYGNHTFKHLGATNAVQLDAELAPCDAFIRACHPERKQPWLVSFGQPGGVPWTVSGEEKRAAFDKYRLVERPPFFGCPIHVKTAEAICGLVDAALAKGEMGHLDFHGVGGDWLATPLPLFAALLDKLEARRAEVWVTDHITYHKYLTERASASVRAVQQSDGCIRLQLACAADPALYDVALTLETCVPPGWSACRIVQGERRAERRAEAGALRYEALPGAGEIVLTPCP